ncbi:hypothetical protein GCM10022419_092120 [Nonomuraea rosea]|uniref:Uncharacterized protein n=1 Tax=Nonomuraea rosea TaxID=638574 RepID=A0ABP6Z3E9_9ACTN
MSLRRGLRFCVSSRFRRISSQSYLSPSRLRVTDSAATATENVPAGPLGTANRGAAAVTGGVRPSSRAATMDLIKARRPVVLRVFTHTPAFGELIMPSAEDSGVNVPFTLAVR